LDISFVAGLFDGEGYVRITRWEKPNSPHIRYSLVAGINMTHRPIIEMMHKEFGGGLHCNRNFLKDKTRRCLFVWTVASQTAAAFLRRVQPHVIVKKDQVDLALVFQSHIDENPYVPRGRPGKIHGPLLREGREELLAFRQTCFEQILAMKKETFAPLDRRPLGRPKRQSLTI
jgi:hypothetical protein